MKLKSLSIKFLKSSPLLIISLLSLFFSCSNSTDSFIDEKGKSGKTIIDNNDFIVRIVYLEEMSSRGKCDFSYCDSSWDNQYVSEISIKIKKDNSSYIIKSLRFDLEKNGKVIKKRHNEAYSNKFTNSITKTDDEFCDAAIYNTYDKFSDDNITIKLMITVSSNSGENYGFNDSIKLHRK